MEEWRATYGEYLVSSQGRIKSLKYGKEKIIKYESIFNVCKSCNVYLHGCKLYLRRNSLFQKRESTISPDDSRRDRVYDA